MSSDRLEVSVTFDAERGYIGSAPELKVPVTALSLGGLRRRIEIALRHAARRPRRARTPPATGAGAARTVRAFRFRSPSRRA